MAKKAVKVKGPEHAIAKRFKIPVNTAKAILAVVSASRRRPPGPPRPMMRPPMAGPPRPPMIRPPGPPIGPPRPPMPMPPPPAV